MKYSNVVVAGGGVLGSQIAFQAAYCGFNVTIWLRSEGSIGRTQPKIDHLKQTYIDAIEKMAEDKNAWCAGLADEDTFDKEECLKKVENAYANLKLELIWLRQLLMQTLSSSLWLRMRRIRLLSMRSLHHSFQKRLLL